LVICADGSWSAIGGKRGRGVTGRLRKPYIVLGKASASAVELHSFGLRQVGVAPSGKLG
jgi:hypothetical protein